MAHGHKYRQELERAEWENKAEEKAATEGRSKKANRQTAPPRGGVISWEQSCSDLSSPACTGSCVEQNNKAASPISRWTQPPEVLRTLKGNWEKQSGLQAFERLTSMHLCRAIIVFFMA